jgi:subtilisin family serine protease
MPSAPRALALLTTATITAALAIAPVSGAKATARAIGAADGLTAKRAPQPKPSTTARRAQAVATDPRLDEQWPLQGDAPMGIDSAWRQTTGGDVTVAVIDSGIDLTHPDLVPNLWTNPGEIPGNGIDDDHNGYVDDVHGFDFIDGDGTPQDQNGHGTHVAGIIGARGGNGVGGAGVAWRVKLMAIRVLDANAQGTTTDVARGIRYAVDNGARIINLSLAGPSSTPDLEAAVQYAQARGVLIVVAAGNDGQDLSGAPTYPAAYGEPNVIGVAATTQSGGLSSVSDYGPGADIAAPGEQILSTALGGGYEWRTGTSMAAPEVSGALALLASVRPDLDATGLENALVAGVRHTGLPVATGSLDVGAALRTVIAPSAWKDAPDATLSTYTSSTPKVSVTKTAAAKKKATKKKAAKKPSKKAKKKTAKKAKKATKKSASKKKTTKKSSTKHAAKRR